MSTFDENQRLLKILKHYNDFSDGEAKKLMLYHMLFYIYEANLDLVVNFFTNGLEKQLLGADKKEYSKMLKALPTLTKRMIIELDKDMDSWYGKSERVVSAYTILKDREMDDMITAWRDKVATWREKEGVITKLVRFIRRSK